MAAAGTIAHVIGQAPFKVEAHAYKNRLAGGLFLQNLDDNLGGAQVAGCVEDAACQYGAEPQAAPFPRDDQLDIGYMAGPTGQAPHGGTQQTMTRSDSQ